MSDSFDLSRFVDAQESVYAHVTEELRSGHKRGHWMWFVFLQWEGLGHSSMARHYAIRSRAEAGAYLAHPVLGPRLAECTALVNAVEGRSAEAILGSVDAMKFRSSMTLFAAIAGEDSPYAEALRKYYAGKRDALTLERLSDGHSQPSESE